MRGKTTPIDESLARVGDEQWAALDAIRARSPSGAATIHSRSRTTVAVSTSSTVLNR